MRAAEPFYPDTCRNHDTSLIEDGFLRLSILKSEGIGLIVGHVPRIFLLAALILALPNRQFSFIVSILSPTRSLGLSWQLESILKSEGYTYIQLFSKKFYLLLQRRIFPLHLSIV